MYYVSKRMEIAGAHKLDLSYKSKCSNLHGHNWIVTVYCRASKLNQDGMVADFTKIKEMVHDKLDHQYLNSVVSFNPTAENMAAWIVRILNSQLLFNTSAECYKVEVQESEGNVAVYELDR